MIGCLNNILICTNNKKIIYVVVLFYKMKYKHVNTPTNHAQKLKQGTHDIAVLNEMGIRPKDMIFFLFL